MPKKKSLVGWTWGKWKHWFCHGNDGFLDMPEITVKWLTEKSACQEGIDWFIAQKETNSIKVLEKLIAEKKLDWANWLVIRVMEYKQYVSYAVFAAEQVIDIYEKKYPNDKRLRQAIDAAKKCIDNPSKENRDAAANAAADAMKKKILEYGIKLLRGEING